MTKQPTPAKAPWYVITGGPSTGKTTLLAELKNLGYHTVEEAARAVIDDAVAKGMPVEELRSDEQAFQEEVVRRRLELEAAIPANISTFIDRGMPDSLAYLHYYDFPIAPWIRDELTKTRYKKVFLMEPLPVYKKDYARTEVLDFGERITDLLIAAYREYGMEPILVPPVSVAERVEIVLRHLKNYEA